MSQDLFFIPSFLLFVLFFYDVYLLCGPQIIELWSGLLLPGSTEFSSVFSDLVRSLKLCVCSGEKAVAFARLRVT